MGSTKRYNGCTVIGACTGQLDTTLQVQISIVVLGAGTNSYGLHIGTSNVLTVNNQGGGRISTSTLKGQCVTHTNDDHTAIGITCRTADCTSIAVISQNNVLGCPVQISLTCQFDITEDFDGGQCAILRYCVECCLQSRIIITSDSRNVFKAQIPVIHNGTFRKCFRNKLFNCREHQLHALHIQVADIVCCHTVLCPESFVGHIYPRYLRIHSIEARNIPCFSNLLHGITIIRDLQPQIINLIHIPYSKEHQLCIRIFLMQTCDHNIQCTHEGIRIDRVYGTQRCVVIVIILTAFDQDDVRGSIR